MLMTENPGDKQIAIKLSEKYISRLDDLAKRGHTNRRQLMVNFVRIWMDELKESNSANFFHLALILRGIEADFKSDNRRRSEFIESNYPEKPFPIMLSEDDEMDISAFAGRANMTRHHMMKSMVITGIEELEELTNNKEYEFLGVRQKLKKAIAAIMAKGSKAAMEVIREKNFFKRIKFE